MSAFESSRRDFLGLCGASTLLAAAASAAEPAATPARSADGSLGPSRFGPADAPVELLKSGADMGSLHPWIERLADAAGPGLLADRPGFRFDEPTRAAARAHVRTALRYAPPAVDLKPERIEQVDCGDYVRERLTYATTPWFRVPAYLLIPKGLSERAPAVVDLHSHGGMFLFGKEKVVDLTPNHPVMTDYHERNYDGRPTATELVRRGYVVLTADTFMFGERRLILDEDLASGWDRSAYSPETVQRLNQKCRAKESTLAKSLALAGVTWPGIVNWDDSRAVDYLAARPEVDAARIGCVGISMGGYRSLYLAALDERIAAACIVGFMSTTRPMLRSHIDTHSWVHFLPHLHPQLDWPELAALAAPRGLFVQQCRQDRLFPLEGMEQALERIARLYASADAADSYVGRFYDAPHRWTKPMQDEAFEWLDRRLRPRGPAR